MRAALVALAMLAGVAQAQPTAPVLRSWQDVARYAGDQTIKLNELQDKLRFQQQLADSQAATIDAQRVTIDQLVAEVKAGRAFVVDLACKWNLLVEQLSKGQPQGWNTMQPVGDPRITYQPPGSRTACNSTEPAPQWNATLP